MIGDNQIPAADLRQFGRQVHVSMAQVIRPFHTSLDGDVLFACSVGEEPLASPAAIAAEFGSVLARQAIFSAIPSWRERTPEELFPCQAWGRAQQQRVQHERQHETVADSEHKHADE
ncbi:hypothetical protein LPW26_02695 [Rhodopseudomonas sp. HC1]|uniref:hypothetical protein n=1 Tax=Rhodopseudomonas infernalis TaxID=2897386 RepID=UPI001EE85E66|nr:hypothetical protein [Rhodopseudomonas infernalis]